MRISDWSSDVCSSDLARHGYPPTFLEKDTTERRDKERSGCRALFVMRDSSHCHPGLLRSWGTSSTLPALPTLPTSSRANRRPSRRSSPNTISAEHTFYLQLPMRNSFAVICLKKQ